VAAACSDPIFPPVDTNLMWFQALLKALLFAQEAGFTDLILEGDCKSKLLEVQKVAVDLSPKGLILEDIKHVVEGQSSFSFSFTYPQCNRALISLAEEACSLVHPLLILCHSKFCRY
jgi:hypothetical protein